MKPYPGLMVQYRCRPGQVRAGQEDLAAMITRVHRDGTADLRIYVPDSHDNLLQSKVMQMSQEVQGHCWHCIAPIGGDPRVEELQKSLAQALDRIDVLEKRMPAPPARKSA